MEKGLRQDDPLSQFLFLIEAKAFQVSILESCDKGVFKGISLTNDRSNPSLLQYADDALIFGDWSFLNAQNLVKVLKWFQDTSGLRINLAKSSIFGIDVVFSEVESGFDY